MSNKKKKASILPWLTANPSGFDDGRFLQIGNSFFLSKQIQVLKDSSFRLYLCMALESAGNRSVKFSHSTAQKYGFNRNTFDSCIKELISVNLIERIEDEEQAQFRASIFQFTPEKFKLHCLEEIERLTGRKRNKKKARIPPSFFN